MDLLAGLHLYPQSWEAYSERSLAHCCIGDCEGKEINRG